MDMCSCLLFLLPPPPSLSFPHAPVEPAHQQLPTVAAHPLHPTPPAAMSVSARTSSERRAWWRAAARNRAVGRMGRFRSREGEGKEARRGGRAGFPAGDVLAPASHEGVDGLQMVEVEEEGEVDGEVEEEEPRSSPGQIRPSTGWPPPQNTRGGARGAS
jgi:hypothetical protein